VPIYEYECTECGERFELYRSIIDSDSERKCPKCGGKCLKRVPSVFGSTSSSGGCGTTVFG